MFYPVEGDPGHVCVCGIHSSGHDSVGVHQLVAQTSLHTRVDAGPGDGGSVELKTLRQQDRVSSTNDTHTEQYTVYESSDLNTFNQCQKSLNTVVIGNSAVGEDVNKRATSVTHVEEVMCCRFRPYAVQTP